MLKSILNLSNVRLLNKDEQKHIKGRDSLMCIVMCGPGDGNVSIYDNNPDLPESLQEEVGCFCV